MVGSWMRGAVLRERLSRRAPGPGRAVMPSEFIRGGRVPTPAAVPLSGKRRSGAGIRPSRAALVLIGTFGCAAGGESSGASASSTPAGNAPGALPSGSGRGDMPAGPSGPIGFPDLVGEQGDVPSPPSSSSTDDAHTQPASVVRCPDANALTAFRGATPRGGLRLSYPYDGTVWPRGLLPPVLQWDGGAGDAVYLKIQSLDYSFEGCFGGAGAASRFAVPDDAWVGAGEWSRGAGDPATITFAVRTGGNIVAATQQWTFALASIKGAIYYNTYGSPKALMQVPPAAGAVLKIVPGGKSRSSFCLCPESRPSGHACRAIRCLPTVRR
jgi:hypothetical protein